MNCYLCSSTILNIRKGKVRDAPDLQILECGNCGLVFLNSFKHINEGFYEQSPIVGAEYPSVEFWLKLTDLDDQRRFEMLAPMLKNKKILDFGCGAGGFLNKASHLAEEVVGIESEQKTREHWSNNFSIYSDFDVLSQAQEKFDIITAFHVLEHLHDPKEMLKSFSALLSQKGRIVIEVPSSEDVLLTLYDSDLFQRFTYWSQHLYLFNSDSLRRLCEQAGFRIITIQQYQRYPLSNHLHWLSQGTQGGHSIWGFLNTPELTRAYANALAAIGKCDTLIAHLEML
jgi:2-polyprenyl-3-methyl-5-hydroxy-6-metoxy-1,4-benzoquinol methylase